MEKTLPIEIILRRSGATLLSIGTLMLGNSAESAAQAQLPRSKSIGCVAVNSLPDSVCTPGAVFPAVTKERICVRGYSKSVRNVPTSEKNQVYREYGITHHSRGEYEVDHLISLELGGSNKLTNLWPEAAVPVPGFHQKDQEENYLHKEVCSGSIPLALAQKEIAGNWLAIYRVDKAKF